MIPWYHMTEKGNGMLVLTAPQSWPFGAALAIMVGLAVVEGAGLLFAVSPSHWLDNLIPDLHSAADGPLGWLHLGKVPILVLLILLLAGFSVSGYAILALVQAVSGILLPAWLAAIPAFFAGVSTVNAVGGFLSRNLPGDHSSAVSAQSLIGRAGVVLRGTAKRGVAAEAKVRDVHGHTHYVMVVPDLPEQSFDEGADILLVKKMGVQFHCIANPHPELL